MAASVGPARLEVERRHHVARSGLVVTMVDEERCHQQVASGTVGRAERDQARGMAALLVGWARNQGLDR